MSNILPTLRYLAATLKHKWFVLRAGLRTGAPIWRLLIHDWTKFLPSEAPHYGRRFYGGGGDALGFAYAWNHHSKANPHHWEYWIPVTSQKSSPVKAGEPLPMPEWAVREMVADWLGAARAYEGSWPRDLDNWGWYRDNAATLRLHDETRALLGKVLDEIFPAV